MGECFYKKDFGTFSLLQPFCKFHFGGIFHVIEILCLYTETRHQYAHFNLILKLFQAIILQHALTNKCSVPSIYFKLIQDKLEKKTKIVF